MRTRIVPYIPFGAADKPLPDPLEVQLVTPMGGLATASIHYPRSGVNATELDGVFELAVEYFNGTSWVEPANARFVGMRGTFDHLEAVPTRRYSCVSLGGWLLRKAKVWAANGLQVDKDGKVQFLTATAGTIMATLFANAKARGWGSGLSVDFSATTDSSGNAWVKVVTIAYELELDLDAVLSNLYQQGVCDYRWEGRKLRLFNPDTTMGRDLTTGANPVRLVVADGQTSAPEEWTNEDRITVAMVLGDDGKRWEFSNAGSSPLGRLESVISQGGVTDPGTANLLAQVQLLSGQQTRISYTREFMLDDDTNVWPFRDYTLGDWVLGQRGTGFERLRTHSLSLTITAGGVKGHAVLGDRLEDLLTKLAKRTRGITGGTSAGGSGTRPAPEGPDLRVPSTPTGLVVGVDVYIDNNGLPQGVVDLDWAHSGNATNGTAMVVDEFQAFYRINEVGQAWKFLSSSSTDTELAYSPLPVFKADGVTPEEYAFMVRARGDNGMLSVFSGVVAAIMATDTTPPPVPFFPAGSVTTWLRTITVRSQGRGTLDGSTSIPMPRDFDYCNVYQAHSADMAGAVLVGTIRGASLWQSTTMTAWQTVWYALTSVDRSGNESAMSSVLAVTPAANVDAAAILSTINAAAVQLTNVGSDSIKTGAVLTSKLADSAVTVAKIKFDGDPNNPGEVDLAANFAKIMKLEVGNLIATNANMDQAVINTLWTSVVNSRKITTNMLVVNGDNQVPDPYFLDDVQNAKRLASGGGPWTLVNDDVSTAKILRSYNHDTAAQNLALHDNESRIQVIPGEKWRFSAYFRLRGSTVTQSSMRFALYYDSPTKGYLGYVGVGSYEVKGGTGPTWQLIESPEWTVPDNAGFIRVMFQVINGMNGEFDIKRPAARKMADASVIVDGAVVTRHLTVTEDMTVKLLSVHKVTASEADLGTFSADTGFVGDMRTAVLTANSVNATQIAATAITSKHTITGAVLQTTATAARGVKFTSAGVFGYSSTGVNTFSISASTGDSIMTGIFQTNPSGQRVKIWDHGDNISAVDMYPDTSVQHGALYSEKLAGTGPYSTNLAHFTNNSDIRARLYLDSNGLAGISSLNSALAFIGHLETLANGDVNVAASRELHMKGKTRGGQTSTDTHLYGNTGPTSVGSGQWSATYSSPVPSGTRKVQLTPAGANIVTASLNNETASMFGFNFSGPSGNSSSFQYTATWRD